MAINEDYLNYVIDQLSNFGDIRVKKMFGRVGLFRDGLMFALIGAISFVSDCVKTIPLAYMDVST